MRDLMTVVTEYLGVMDTYEAAAKPIVHKVGMTQEEKWKIVGPHIAQMEQLCDELREIVTAAR